METLVKYDIREITFPAKNFIAKRATVAFDELADFFARNYDEIYNLVKKLGLEASEPPCAVYYTVDEIKKITDLAAAVPVKGNIPEIKEFEKIVIPESRAVTTTHHGSYDNMRYAYDALEKYMKEHTFDRAHIIEEYLSDPAVEKDPSNWQTNIYFILK